MKMLLTASVLLLGLGSAAVAQSQQTVVGETSMSGSSLLVRDMVGAPVYNFRGRPNTDSPMPLDGVDRFERIATIKDVMINADGTVEAIVMNVGGFWGLAGREVTAAMDGVTVVTDVRGDKYFVIYTYDEVLKAAPRFNKFNVR